MLPTGGSPLDMLGGGGLSTSSAAMSRSGDVYAAQNSPFTVGGGSGSSFTALASIAPWVAVGVVAWLVLRK